jgi:hypothetical protein
LIKNKFEFLYQKNQHPDSWNDIPYWEFEEYIKLFNERSKEESEERKKQDEQQSSQMPNMNNFKAPNYKIPNFNSFKK